MREKGLTKEETAAKAEAQSHGVKDGVVHVRQNLEEMELTFKRDIKRRKLQVEQSFVKNDGDQIHPIMKPVSSVESRALKLDRILLTPEVDDEKDETREDWEPAVDGEEITNEDALDPADRGAKRSPAINSDVLPLPWKGRLGYVCVSHLHDDLSFDNTLLKFLRPA